MRVEAFNTIYAIYYATNSKIIRRVVVPEYDHHLFDGTHECGPGESVTYANAGNNDEMPEWENKIFDATGVVPPDARCALIRGNEIVDYMMADPELDSVPGCRLVLLSELEAMRQLASAA